MACSRHRQHARTRCRVPRNHGGWSDQRGARAVDGLDAGVSPENHSLTAPGSALRSAVLRGVASAVERLTTPLLPDDYLTLLNPLWSGRQLRGRLEAIHPETADAATLVI